MDKRVSKNHTSEVRGAAFTNGEFPVADERNSLWAWMDDSPAAMHRNDPKGKIVAVNKRWCEITGRSSADAMGTGWKTMIHPDDLEALAGAWESYVREVNRGLRKDGFCYLYRLMHIDGTWVRMCARCSDERDADGKLIGFYGASLEVPETWDSSIAQTSKMGSDEESLIFQQDNSPLGKFWTGADGKCVKVNEALVKISGWPAENILGDRWAQVIHPGDIHRVVRLWNEASKGRKPFIAEYRYVKPDGTVVWIISRVFVQRNRLGDVLSYMGVVVDISELRGKQGGKKRASRRRAKYPVSQSGRMKSCDCFAEGCPTNRWHLALD